MRADDDMASGYRWGVLQHNFVPPAGPLGYDGVVDLLLSNCFEDVATSAMGRGSARYGDAVALPRKRPVIVLLSGFRSPMRGRPDRGAEKYNFDMRHFTRLALHWLVVIAMIATTVVAPAQAAGEALQVQVAGQMAPAMADMPCGDAVSQTADHEMPCGCCPPASCDLSVCLGTACLPEWPRLASAIPPVEMPLPLATPAPPSRFVDTPLRPPIA